MPTIAATMRVFIPDITTTTPRRGNTQIDRSIFRFFSM